MSENTRKVFFFISGIVVMSITFALGWFAHAYIGTNNISLKNPFVDQTEIKAQPLLQYSFSNLAKREYQPATVTIERTLETTDAYTSYLFSYETTGRRITGVLNVPSAVSAQPSVIVMIRGWVPKERYYSGMGTRNAAAVYARNGYITVAPDFLGHGESDPEIDDEWESRFARPVHVIELIRGLQQHGVPLTANAQRLTPVSAIGLWGHSNGGQIALSVLEILQEPIPTTLWAPVTAPFPYSILYFSDEDPDEGKALRKVVSLLEDTYDVFDFTVTQHLDRLTGPIQLHHGTADEAAPITWSDEFMLKVNSENKRREQIRELLEAQAATDSAAQATLSASLNKLDTLDFTYFRYPGANHNLQPGWDTVVQRDLQFFKQTL